MKNVLLSMVGILTVAGFIDAADAAAGPLTPRRKALLMDCDFDLRARQLLSDQLDDDYEKLAHPNDDVWWRGLKPIVEQGRPVFNYLEGQQERLVALKNDPQGIEKYEKLHAELSQTSALFYQLRDQYELYWASLELKGQVGLRTASRTLLSAHDSKQIGILVAYVQKQQQQEEKAQQQREKEDSANRQRWSRFREAAFYPIAISVLGASAFATSHVVTIIGARVLGNA